MGLKMLAWSSLATGPFAGADPPASATNEERRPRARELADRRGSTATAIALAYVLHQPEHVLPVVGRGEGMTSFVHIEDAAAATVVALDHGGPGIYNVVDDEPARFREWLPVYAEALGAKRPRRLPVWLARVFAGPMVGMISSLRGASNAKAKGVLGWQPIYPSWREGFRKALG